MLEHIELDKLLLVLDDLRRCVQQVGYFVIHTGPAVKKYADGRNTHLIQKDAVWWEKILNKFFDVGKVIPRGTHLHIVVGPKKKKDAPAPDPAVPLVPIEDDVLEAARGLK